MVVKCDLLNIIANRVIIVAHIIRITQPLHTDYKDQSVVQSVVQSAVVTLSDYILNVLLNTFGHILNKCDIDT